MDGASRISRQVDALEAQFEIGSREACLILVCTEDGLVNLIAQASSALDELRTTTPADECPR